MTEAMNPTDLATDAHAVDSELIDPEQMDSAQLDAALEALLLVVDAPTDEATLATAVEQPVERVRAALQRLAEAYAAAGLNLEGGAGGHAYCAG